jgi:DNA (cytosine-5)-methyltransferase 1
MTVYYNEIDTYCAEWLQELISAGHIADGVVDTRSIEDVHPSDLRGFKQCHFFAGIGVWSHALRRAGWGDDRPVWTGSCPCQPFSAAGQGAGFADERHLWPAFHHLISECRPAAVLGEQVASSNAGPWIDLVHTDLEALDYAFGAVPFPAAGVGAPHPRERAYWVAHTTGTRSPHQRRRRIESARSAESSATGRLADTARSGRREERADAGGVTPRNPAEGNPAGLSAGGCDLRPGPTNGYWSSADWLGCRDGYWRPVQPGTFPLAHGAPARVGRLRAYGNAINAEAARVFIEAVMGAAA